DGTRRVTRIEFSTDPLSLEVVGDLIRASFRLRLGAYQTRLVAMTIEPRVGDEVLPANEFDTAVHDLRRSYEEWERDSTQVVTDNEVYDQMLNRCLRDLRALYTTTSDGAFLAAGIPWYVTLFGRDSMIASHQMLMISPEPARRVLEVLAASRGTKEDDWRDEQPGKILHEL